jgi:hypothetical protein
MSEEEFEIISLEELKSEEEKEESLINIPPKMTTYTFLMMRQNNYRYMTNIFSDDNPLPNKTSKRYCMNYWQKVGMPVKYNSSIHFKTQKDLDREQKAKDDLIPKVQVDQGEVTWTQEESIEYLEKKKKIKPSKPSKVKSQLMTWDEYERIKKYIESVIK